MFDKYLILPHLGVILFLIGISLLARAARADSIPAEEIEVPPPTWSIFYEEEPEPELVLPPVESPHDWDNMEPLVVTEPPARTPIGPIVAAGVPPALVGVGLITGWCWLPWLCNDNDGGGNGSVLPPSGPPPGPPTPAIPEPGAFLVFGAGLLLLARGRR